MAAPQTKCALKIGGWDPRGSREIWDIEGIGKSADQCDLCSGQAKCRQHFCALPLASMVKRLKSLKRRKSGPCELEPIGSSRSRGVAGLRGHRWRGEQVPTAKKNLDTALMKGLAPVTYYSANKTSCSSFARRGKQSPVKPGDHLQVVEPTLVSRTTGGLLTAVLFGGVFFFDTFFAGAFCVAFATILLLTVFAATFFFTATLLDRVFLPTSFALPPFAEPALSTRNRV